MRMFPLVSCPSIRATLRQIERLACGLVALLAFTLPVHAVDLLYVSMDDDTIATFDVSSGDATTIANSKATFASGLKYPQGMVFDSSSNLYVANSGGDSISKISPGGSVSTFVASGLNSPFGLTIDSSGNLYVSRNITLDGDIRKISPGGSVSTFASGLNQPHGLAFDSSGNLYAANRGNSTISKFNSTGGLVYSFSTGGAAPLFLTFGPAPVPEPSTYALAAIAAGVMGMIARRRRACKSA